MIDTRATQLYRSMQLECTIQVWMLSAGTHKFFLAERTVVRVPGTVLPHGCLPLMLGK
jgi:hypothetical protein